MSADLLRRAAAVLRERAEAAEKAAARNWYVTEGPVGDSDIYAPDPDSPIFPFDVAKDLHDEGLAAYIATMHPGVGLALADWLDAAIPSREAADRVPLDASWWDHEIAVARAVLGEAA